MRIQQIRIANILFTGILLITSHPVYIWYITAMHVSLEMLNRKQLYWQQNYTLYNLIFWVYELVLLERLQSCFFSEQTEWLLNCAEHLCFGIVICLKMYVYTAMFIKPAIRQRWIRGAVAFLVFNLTGVFNEIFQNNLAGRSLTTFIPDSIKDIQVNLMGAGVFFIAVLCRIYVLHNNNRRRCTVII